MALTGKTSSGMQYAVRRSGSAVAYCSLSIKCGTRDEAGYNSGIAHFTEHTLFKGTTRRKARTINSYLDRLGGELNAFTTKEEIVLHATVLKEDISKACSLLLEVATESVFPEREVEIERGVILDEIISYKDSPADDIYDHFEENLFSGHNLSGLILGTASSVKKITSAELRRFFARHFIPSNMAFCVVADIDEKRLAGLVEKLSAKYTGMDASASLPSRELSETFSCPKFDIVKDKRNHEVNAVFGSTAPSLYGERKRTAAILLSNLFGGPASNSILNEILREKNGWVYGVESSYTQYSDTGIMAISLGCDKNRIEACRSAIFKEIVKLQSIPLSEARLKAAKKQLLGQLAISSDNGEAQCISMGKSLLSFGKVASDDEIRKEIESITSTEILEAAREIFAPEKMCSMIYL